jgi:flagellar biosynthesis protein FliR
MSVDIFAPGTAAGLVLFSSRAGGMILVAPIFSSKTVPMTVRTGLLLLLTWVLTPIALANTTGVPPLTPATVLTEALIGFTIGFGAAILLAAAESAGDLLALQMGLSGAASLDPISFASVPVLGTFANLFALAVMIAMDGHLLMIDSLAASTQLLPLGAPVDVESGLWATIGLGSTIFALGFRFAAPVIATIILANIALGLLTRAAPQLQVLSVAFPLQIGVGLLMFTAAVPLIATFFLGWTGVYESMLMHIFTAFGAGR